MIRGEDLPAALRKKLGVAGQAKTTRKALPVRSTVPLWRCGRPDCAEEFSVWAKAERHGHEHGRVELILDPAVQ